MPETIISDASCFIILSKIGELEILQKTYGQVLTTTTILIEFGEPLPQWVIVRDPASQNFSAESLGKGETSAIALALEIANSVVVLDDQRARRVAEQMGLVVTGTIGVFLRAKAEGVISSIKPLMAKMRGTNFRISHAVVTEALLRAGEDDGP